MKNDSIYWIIGIIALILVFNIGGIGAYLYSLIAGPITNADFVYQHKLVGYDIDDNPIFTPSLISGGFNLNPNQLVYDESCDTGTRTFQDAPEVIDYGKETEKIIPGKIYGPFLSGVYSAPSPAPSCWKTSTAYYEFLYSEQKEVVKGIFIGSLPSGIARGYHPCKPSSACEEVFGIKEDAFINSFYVLVNKSLITAEIVDDRKNVQLYSNYSVKVKVNNQLGADLMCRVEYSPLKKIFIKDTLYDHKDFPCPKGDSFVTVDLPTDTLGDVEFTVRNIDLMFYSGDNLYPVVIKTPSVQYNYNVMPWLRYSNGTKVSCIDNADCSNDGSIICSKWNCIKSSILNNITTQPTIEEVTTGLVAYQEDMTTKEKDYILYAIVVIILLGIGGFIYKKYK